MKIFILEDDPERIKKFRRNLIGHELDITTTVDEGKKYINKKYDLIFLDHDLGGHQMVDSGEGTGYELAALIADTVNKNSAIIIHSLNHYGASAMHFCLPDAQRIPFIVLNFDAVVEWAEWFNNKPV